MAGREVLLFPSKPETMVHPFTRAATAFFSGFFLLFVVIRISIGWQLMKPVTSCGGFQPTANWSGENTGRNLRVL
jgi:hypothetical protein